MGIDWKAAGREKFERIVDVLLGREFGERGYPVNGRGGDGGMDYCVDDGKIILEYKYFPDGFSASAPSRRNQIKRSFDTAMTRNPDEWILVVPCTLTPHERAYVTRLGKGRRVKVKIRDQAWLNDQLSKYRDLAEFFSRGSDIETLYRMAEAFKHNPVLRNATDVAGCVGDLRTTIDTIDPDWTLDFHSTADGITQTLRPKDPQAAMRSPFSISGDILADSPEAAALQRAEAFGYTEPIILTRDLVQNVTVTGPPLLGKGTFERLELQPLPETAPWTPAELVVANADGEQLGMYLADTRLRAVGRQGSTLELKVGHRVELMLRCPNETSRGDADFVSRDMSDAPIAEVLEAAGFLTDLARGATLELRSNGSRIVLLDLSGPAGDLQRIAAGFEDIRSVCEDLKVIEDSTRARFRFPAELGGLQRIMIRCLRLMLEGHCVVHPVLDSFRTTLNGEWDESLDQILSTQQGFLKFEQRSVPLTVLGQQVVVPALVKLALVQLDQEQVDRAKSAYAAGTAEGLELVFALRPGDRVRMYLPDRFPADQTPEFTPWDLPGVEQPGVRFDRDL